MHLDFCTSAILWEYYYAKNPPDSTEGEPSDLKVQIYVHIDLKITFNLQNRSRFSENLWVHVRTSVVSAACTFKQKMIEGPEAYLRIHMSLEWKVPWKSSRDFCHFF